MRKENPRVSMDLFSNPDPFEICLFSHLLDISTWISPSTSCITYSKLISGPASACSSLSLLHFSTSSVSTSHLSFEIDTGQLVIFDVSIYLVPICNQSPKNVHSTSSVPQESTYFPPQPLPLFQFKESSSLPCSNFLTSFPVLHLPQGQKAYRMHIGIEEVHAHLRRCSLGPDFHSGLGPDITPFLVTVLIPSGFNTCSTTCTGPSFQFILPSAVRVSLLNGNWITLRFSPLLSYPQSFIASCCP